jgi:uncharacterized membrane protein YccC
MPRWPKKLTYCIANVAAVLAALYIAFWLDLDRPYWAMFTVFIVSKPISGAVRAKGVYRFIGTLVGASMSVFLVPPLVQSPVLLSLVVSTWVGLCLFFALQDRTPRSYAFLLAGYSVTIVGLSAVYTPTAIFDVALSRLEEISIGIVCAAIAHSVFFPRNLGDVLQCKAQGALANAALVASNAFGPEPKPPSTQQVASLASAVTAMHTLYSQTSFETSNVRRAPMVMAGLLDRISIILPNASSVAEALTARRRIGPIPDPLRAELNDAGTALTAFAEGKVANVDATLANLEALSEMFDEQDATKSVELEQLAIRHAADLLRSVQEGTVLAPALTDADAAGEVSALFPDSSKRPLYRDQALALLSAASAAGATLIACFLWIVASWPEGFVAAQFAAICCSLFATLDRPSEEIGGVIIGIILSLPIAAVYEFAILPGVDGFASLALVLSPMLILFSFLQTFERLEGAAMVIAIAFSGALALQESFASDFASFVNANLAEICGPLIAVAMLLVFRTIDPVWNAKRMIRSVWSSVHDLARAAPTNSGAWALQMFDRIGMAAKRLDAVNADVAGPDLLRDMRVGLNIIALQNLKDQFTSTMKVAMQDVVSHLSEMYLTAVPHLSQSRFAALSNRLNILADLLSDMPRCEERLDGLIAVNGLRLDLAETMRAEFAT